MQINEHGSCWHLLRGVCKRTQQLPTLSALGRYFGLNNSPFCPKLFLYLFIGPLTFFPQIIVFIWHVPEARVFLEVSELFHLVVWPSFSAITRVFQFFCLTSHVSSNYSRNSAWYAMFITIQKEENALRLFVFWKKYFKARAQTFSWGQHCWGSMQTGATLLHYASPVTEQ